MDSNKLNILSQFVGAEYGWALIPLHDVAREGGACSCGAGAYPEHGSAGKHPRNVAWQRGGWVQDVATLASVVRDRPGWNWGAVTGTPSGVWVLDVDPDNGGYASLGALLDAAHLKLDLPYALCVGALVTRMHRTGSGGLHLIFAIGADGWMPPTSVGRAGRLGPGLDVRAEGGQVVLPSSVSGKGAYSVVLDAAPAECPASLRAEIERRMTVEPRAAVAIRPQDLEQSSVTEGGDRYARAVVEGNVAEMRTAPV